MESINKKTSLRILSVIYFLSSSVWLLSAYANHLLLRGPNLSEAYQASNMRDAGLFRLFALLGIVTLGVSIYIARHDVREKFGRHAVDIFYGGLLLMAVPVLLPIRCQVAMGVCSPVNTFSSSIHASALALLGGLFLGGSTYLAYRQRKLLWMPLVQFLCIVGLYVGHSNAPTILLTVEMLYTLTQLYWVYYLFYRPSWRLEVAEKNASRIRKVLAYFVAANGLVSLLTAAHLYHVGRRAGGLLFVNDTAWLVQHSVVVGLVLLLLSRSMARGSALARRIVLALAAMEIIKFAAITPRPADVIGYGLLALVLIFSENLFTRHNSPERFVNRLKSTVLVLAITAGAVVILSVGFHAFNLNAWKRSTLSTSRIVKRTLLLEISPDADDSLKARLFEQALNAAGIFLYSWLFLGLFLPGLLPHHSDDDEGSRVLVKHLLERYGTSSEDSLKLWPKDKAFWVGPGERSAIAFKQANAMTFALAEPISHPSRRREDIVAFRDFCRQKGSHACWLMIQEKNLGNYQKAGYKTMAIGSSAVVDMATFTSQTVKDKWWRWARNKAKKQGLEYVTLPAPQNDEILTRLKTISDDWLQRDGHSERTFALGYFDADFLKDCIIHALKNQAGEIVAFANQLPSFGPITQTTIDLMRFLPDAEGAMALLLSETILQLKQEGKFTHFDLGFVPLAHVGKEQTTKLLLNLSKKALKPVFSMQGLEQFKNKFEPMWEQNYLAWDGDMLDLPVITASLQKALSLPKK